MDRQRGLFPLPSLFDVETKIAKNSPSSRRSRSRLNARLSVDARAEAAMHALNALAGHSEPGVLVGAAGVQHRAVREHILGAVRDMGASAPDQTPAEAFGELRGASIYEEDHAGPVRPLDPASVSLPKPGHQPVPLAKLYGSGGLEFVQGFVDRSLAKPEEVRAALGVATATPYMDDGLRKDRTA